MFHFLRIRCSISSGFRVPLPPEYPPPDRRRHAPEPAEAGCFGDLPPDRPFDRPLGASDERLGVEMDTDGARRLNRSSPSCLNRGAQRTDFFHGLLGRSPSVRGDWPLTATGPLFALVDPVQLFGADHGAPSPDGNTWPPGSTPGSTTWFRDPAGPRHKPSRELQPICRLGCRGAGVARIHLSKGRRRHRRQGHAGSHRGTAHPELPATLSPAAARGTAGQTCDGSLAGRRGCEMNQPRIGRILVFLRSRTRAFTRPPRTSEVSARSVRNPRRPRRRSRSGRRSPCHPPRVLLRNATDVAFVVKSGPEGQPSYSQSFRDLPPAAVYISVHNS